MIPMEAGGRWMMDGTAASAWTPGGDDNNHHFLGVGYRFRPTDLELVDYFLRGKIMGVPITHPIIHTINIYETHPRDILCKYGTVGEDACYFFVKQSRKRPSRKAGNGYWRASGSHPVRAGKKEIGSKKTFAYHEGFQQKSGSKGLKTDWLMQEFTLNHNTGDDYVLVKIYYHKKNGKENITYEEEEEEEEFNNNLITTPSDTHHDDLLVPAANNNMEQPVLTITGDESVETMLSSSSQPMAMPTQDCLQWLDQFDLEDELKLIMGSNFSTKDYEDNGFNNNCTTPSDLLVPAANNMPFTITGGDEAVETMMISSPQPMSDQDCLRWLENCLLAD